MFGAYAHAPDDALDEHEAAAVSGGLSSSSMELGMGLLPSHVAIADLDNPPGTSAPMPLYGSTAAPLRGFGSRAFSTAWNQDQPSSDFTLESILYPQNEVPTGAPSTSANDEKARQLLQNSDFWTGETDTSSSSSPQPKRLKPTPKAAKLASVDKHAVSCFACFDDPKIDICGQCGCRACGSRRMQNAMWQCVQCRSRFHAYCVDPAPPLPRPDLSWYCPSCRINQTGLAPDGTTSEHSSPVKDAQRPTLTPMQSLLVSDFSKAQHSRRRKEVLSIVTRRQQQRPAASPASPPSETVSPSVSAAAGLVLMGQANANAKKKSVGRAVDLDKLAFIMGASSTYAGESVGPMAQPYGSGGPPGRKRSATPPDEDEDVGMAVDEDEEWMSRAVRGRRGATRSRTSRRSRKAMSDALLDEDDAPSDAVEVRMEGLDSAELFERCLKNVGLGASVVQSVAGSHRVRASGVLGRPLSAQWRSLVWRVCVSHLTDPARVSDAVLLALLRSSEHTDAAFAAIRDRHSRLAVQPTSIGGGVTPVFGAGHAPLLSAEPDDLPPLFDLHSRTWTPRQLCEAVSDVMPRRSLKRPRSDAEFQEGVAAFRAELNESRGVVDSRVRRQAIDALRSASLIRARRVVRLAQSAPAGVLSTPHASDARLLAAVHRSAVQRVAQSALLPHVALPLLQGLVASDNPTVIREALATVEQCKDQHSLLVGEARAALLPVRATERGHQGRPSSPTDTVPQIAGVSTRLHSAELRSAWTDTPSGSRLTSAQQAIASLAAHSHRVTLSRQDFSPQQAGVFAWISGASDTLDHHYHHHRDDDGGEATMSHHHHHQ
jgi:hypothetical protein